VSIGDLGFVLASRVPILIAAAALTTNAAAYADHAPLPAPWLAPVAGAGCYLLAWIAAGPLLALLTARGILVPGSQTRSGLFWDAVALVVAGAATGALLGVGMQLAAMLRFFTPEGSSPGNASLPDNGSLPATLLTVLGVSWIILAVSGGELIYTPLSAEAEISRAR
jgi:hypothetical protein